MTWIHKFENNSSNSKFNKNPFSGSRVVICIKSGIHNVGRREEGKKEEEEKGNMEKRNKKRKAITAVP
jgi:hypothetical protein